MADEQDHSIQARPRWRFDIVVLNCGRAKSFTENSWRISNLTSDDRLSFVTASPSREEENVIGEWASRNRVAYRYLPRLNRGMAELARCEYFTGQCGGSGNMRDS